MKCPVCYNNEWLPYISLSGGQAITTDHRVISADTFKVRCSVCSVVKSKNILESAKLEKFYSKSYALNTAGGEEHRFFDKNGSITRSESVFNWLKPFIPVDSKQLLEVGCGEGNLLARLANNMPGISLKGYEANIEAVALAKKKGLDVSQKYITPDYEVEGTFDVIIASGVIEHVVNIKNFIRFLKASLKPNGRILITLPVQDFKGYDVFFIDHIRHLTSDHVVKFLSNNGLRVVHHDYSDPNNYGMGLFVCETTDKNVNLPINDFSMHYSEILDIWNEFFSSFNRKIKTCAGKKNVIFGASEFCTLIFAFTQLKEVNIVACIDETIEKKGTMKHGIPVYGLDWIEKNTCDCVVLAIHPKYYNIVEEKLKKYPVDIIPKIKLLG